MDLFDLGALVGLAMLFAGLWLLSPWLALTVTGGLLATGSFVGSRLAALRDVISDRQDAR